MTRLKFLRITGVVCGLFLVLCAVQLHAQDIDTKVFDGYIAAFVLHNRSTGENIEIAPQLSDRRLPPCSTFKIYNTLIGLELGLIKNPDAGWYAWDGVVRSIEGWNKDLTLREAFKVSAVPAYQVLARQIGEERMKKYIDALGYGTKDISSGIDIFWLERPGKNSIKISAREQVALLNRLLDGQLPFAKENVAVLKDVMTAVKTDKGTLYGKTGTAMDDQNKATLGWYVGFLESKGAVYVFACNITGGNEPSGKIARGIVEQVFTSLGLL